MIHTDGRPTIANAPRDRTGTEEWDEAEAKARLDKVARDIAAAYSMTLDEARAVLVNVSTPRLPTLRESLHRDDPALD